MMYVYIYDGYIYNGYIYTDIDIEKDIDIDTEDDRLISIYIHMYK